MKFDAIIMNPPYGKLGPKILKTLVEEKVAEELVTIQPLYQFTTVKPQGDKNRTLSNGENIDDYISNVVVKNGNAIWSKGDVCFLYTLGLIKIQSNKTLDIKCKYDGFNFYNQDTTFNMNELTEIYSHGGHNKYKEISSRIIYKNSILDIKDNGKTFRFRRSGIGKGVLTDELSHDGTRHGLNHKVHVKFVFNIIAKNSFIKDSNGNIVEEISDEVLATVHVNNKGSKPGKDPQHFGFDSINEAVNAREYLRSNFVRFCLSRSIVDVHIDNIDMKQIPLFNFSSPVTNERIQKEFNLTDVEMEFISDFGKQLNGENIDWSKYD